MFSDTKIMLASEDTMFNEQFASAVQASSGIIITGIFYSGTGLLAALQEKKPDVLIIDYLLPGVNTFSILQELSQMTYRPVIFVLSSFVSQETLTECDRLGISFFLRKPVTVSALLDLVCRYGTSSHHQPKLQNNSYPSLHEISMRVTQILHSLKIPSHVAGFRYVRECILETLLTPEKASSVTKILYPDVAKKYHTSWTSVERDIRNALELGWKRNGGRMPGFSTPKRPANREFIHNICDRIRYEMHLDEGFFDTYDNL